MSEDWGGVLGPLFLFLFIASLPYTWPVVLALVVAGVLAWCLWRAWCRRTDCRRHSDELDRIAYERDRTVANMIALRQQAEREMVEIAREGAIEGTATEVERRR